MRRPAAARDKRAERFARPVAFKSPSAPVLPPILPPIAPVPRANSLWALQDLNLGPTDYESAALTT